MQFKDLSIGDTFDFIGPDRMMNSFYARCRKLSARKYEWEENGIRYLGSVGSIKASVYHVNETAGL